MKNLWHVVKSVLSAMLGVRPSKEAEEDFAQQSLWPYLLVGVLFILGFIGVLMTVVTLVLG
jgi:hypothetical protein